ncbi:MAG: hypothetical protein AAGD11_13195 [Planctomycetota bacterium]
MIRQFSSTDVRASQSMTRRLLVAAWIVTAWAIVGTSHSNVARAQPDRQSLLEAEPLAEAKVQKLKSTDEDEYDDENPLMMYQPLEEDPLSFYVRTQDGEWRIPSRVDARDPWVRLLILGPVRPTLVELAIEINHLPFRAAREAWIDRLLAEARAASLVRTGTAAVDAAAARDTANSQLDNASSIDAEGDVSTDGLDGVAEDEPQGPMVTAQRRQASSLFKRLINYLAADQSTAEREEVRWLLAEWTGGPAQLTLSPAFAWRRANAAPLWQTLDLDGDRVLSAEEISAAAVTLKQTDINRDEILSFDELTRQGKKHSSNRQTNGYPLIVVIHGETDWGVLKQQLRQAYPSRSMSAGVSQLLDRIAIGDRSVDTADLVNLVTLPSDLVYRVVFANNDAKAQLLATATSSTGKMSGDDGAWRFRSSNEHTITVEREEAYMELTAAQGDIDEQNTSGDMQQTQVAVGAVVDGYPLLRLLDYDNNRQLTQRERNNIRELLASLDRNQNGRIEAAEIPTAIRLSVTLGPFAHEQLATATAASRPTDNSTEVADLPAWFVGMDRNHDGDLSKREFQGSPGQFRKFDRDKDGLISSLEVIAAESKN